ncbi:MAG: BON domain-containing protein [Armatimonadetes bacterium]|nr:BON domain-containing protein [Armatimonadota bacterium]MDW8120842.1 BON domain-containing protein [Armatimonadota bacterium]
MGLSKGRVRGCARWGEWFCDMEGRQRIGPTAFVIFLFLFAPGQIPGQDQKWRVHVVRPGETLYRVASLYRTSVAELCRWNNIRADEVLFVGQVLRLVPGETTVQLPAPALPSANNRPQTGVLQRSLPDTSVTPNPHPHPHPHSNPSPVRQRVIQVEVGKAVPLTVPTIKSVSIANPEVADVQILTPTTIAVLGRAVGSTTLIVVSDRRTLLYQISVIPDPLMGKHLQALLPPTVRVEAVRGALVLTGTASSPEEKDRALALARIFSTTVIDLIRIVEEEVVEEKPPVEPQIYVKDIEDAIAIPTVRVRLVGDTLVLEGEVANPEEAARAEKTALLYRPKVVNLLSIRPMTAEEVQALIPIPTVKVRQAPGALVIEGIVTTQEDLQRINEAAGQARQKVFNWVRVVPPPPEPGFARRVQEAIGIPTIQVQGDEKGLVLMGTVESQAQKERALRIANFMVGEGAPAPEREGRAVQPSPTGMAPTGIEGAGGVLPGFALIGPTPAPPPEAPSRVLDLIEVKGGRQIRVDLRVVEINRTALRDLGIDYPALTTTAPPTVQLQVGQAANPATGGVTGIAQRTPIVAFIRALEQKNLARTLSAPSTVVLSGQNARFFVGGEIPILSAQVVSAAGITTTIRFEPFGIILQVTPTVEPTGKIRLRIDTEVSQLDPTTAIVVAGSLIPGKQRRTAQTIVELDSEQTLTMSGLIQRVRTETVNRIPVLGRIPILGELFTSRRFQTGETELAILVTPTLLEPETGLVDQKEPS